MANRLEQIRRIKQGIVFAKEHAKNSDWQAAIVVQGALIEQLLALAVSYTTLTLPTKRKE